MHALNLCLSQRWDFCQPNFEDNFKIDTYATLLLKSCLRTTLGPSKSDF